MKTYGQLARSPKQLKSSPQRWTPLIIRELLMGSRKFRERGILDAPHSPLLINGAP